MTDGLTFPKVDFCPNCGDKVDAHPVKPRPGADASSPFEGEREEARLNRHLRVCPLYQKHVRRSIAVTAALLFREANK